MEAKIPINFSNSSKIGQKCDYYCRRHGPLEKFVRFACHAQCKCPFCGDHWRCSWSELSAPKTRMCGELHLPRQIRLAVSFSAKYIFVKLNFIIKRLIKTRLFIQYLFKTKTIAENNFLAQNKCTMQMKLWAQQWNDGFNRTLITAALVVMERFLHPSNNPFAPFK